MKTKSLILCLVAVLFCSCFSVSTHVLNGDLTVYNADGSVLQEYKDITWTQYTTSSLAGEETSTAGQPTNYQGMFSFTTSEGKSIIIANAPWKFEYYDLTEAVKAELAAKAKSIRNEFVQKCNDAIKEPEGAEIRCVVCGKKCIKHNSAKPYNMVTCSDDCARELEYIIDLNNPGCYSNEEIIRRFGSGEDD